jgi:hypothetical protein
MQYILFFAMLVLSSYAYPTSVKKSFEVKIRFVEMSSGSYHITFANPQLAKRFQFAMFCKLDDGKLRILPLSNIYTNIISKQALKKFRLHNKRSHRVHKSADDGGRNWDGGADCGGSNECHCYRDWINGPHAGNCHGPVVGSPGANGCHGVNKFLDIYPKGLDGPDES